MPPTGYPGKCRLDTVDECQFDVQPRAARALSTFAKVPT
jgi:hypothetical protein